MKNESQNSTNGTRNSDEIERQKILLAIVKKIYLSLELEAIFQFTVAQVRELFKADRVSIYQFEGNLDPSQEEFVIEDRGSVYTHDINFSIEDLKQAYQTYSQGDGLWLVNDIREMEWAKSNLLETQAHLGVRLGKIEALWGLLIVQQYSASRHWEQAEILFIEQIALQLGIAVEQAKMRHQQENHSEQLNQAVEQAIEREQTLAKIIDKIWHSLDIQTIFTSTTQELRQLLKADRVALYQFNPDYSGTFIMESVDQRWSSLLEKQQEPQVRENCDECTLKLLPNAQLSDTYLQSTQGEIFTHQDLFRVCNDVYQAGFSECYIELLERYEAKAYIVVAIYQKDRLWGLLGAYQNSGPRTWQDSDINFLVQVGVNLGIALQQANLLTQMQQHQEQLETSLAVTLSQQAEKLAKTAEWERSLAKVIDKIRCTLELDTIFQTAATEVQKLLGVEHITIYQFDEHYGGEFIFESEPGPFASLVGHRWDDDYLQATQGGRFKENQPCIIDNVGEDERFSECHVRALENLQVKSMVAVALFRRNELWGLLSAFQHTHPRAWLPDEVKLLQQVGHHLGIALQQVHYLHKIQDYAAEQAIAVEQERALSDVIDKIRRTLDLETIFQTTATEVRQLLQADRVAIFRFEPDSQYHLAQLISEDVAPGFISGLTAKVEDHCFAKENASHYQQGQIFSIDDVENAQISDCYRQLLSRFEVRANLVTPLLKGEKLWGILCIHQCSGPRKWQISEKQFVTRIAAHLCVAIQQAKLLAQTQQRSEALQQALAQVQQQKNKLEQIAAQEKALARVIERIRQTLNLERIFSTTTQEVRQMLKCDRVVVYRFYDNWSGEFCYESVGKGWKSLIEEKPIWEDTYLQKNQGGRYRTNETLAINNIYQADFKECHIEILEQFQVKAFVVSPVFVANKLWGLLAVYQNSSSRIWKNREIGLIKQVSNQLGVAIYQGELLTKTQQQSEVLQTTVADLNAIVDNLGDGLLVVDIYGKITRFNPVFLSMFNLNESPQGKYLTDVFSSELAQILEDKKQQLSSLVTTEVELAQGRSGQALVNNIIKEAEGEEGEHYLGKVILIRDVTIEKEIERVKNNFMATVSHELRTPLTSVLGFASLIRDKLNNIIFPVVPVEDKRTEKALTQIKQNLDIIVSESERLRTLVNDVLDMAKMEAGKVQYNFKLVSPVTILERAIAATFPLFEEQNLPLIKDFLLDLPLIMGDEDRLIQVVINLLSNSVKFTEVGSVTCHARIDNNQLLIAITDTGIGIAENEQSKVFNPFEQMGNILTNKPKGTGLGLSICQEIVENHGGKICVKSQLGNGSTFYFTIPLDRQE